MNILIGLIIGNTLLAILGGWMIYVNHREYYEELGSPNFVFAGPKMITFMFGHVLSFAYLTKTSGGTRIILVLWSLVLWVALIQMFF